MDLLSPMKETVYGTGSISSDDSHVMSEKVQNIAGNIYQEFEKMIRKYDEDVVKELMPLVVSVLEDLDLSYVENQEHEVELELLRVDNEQLVTQFEREKQLRKAVEQKLLEIEYGMDDDKRDLQSKVESLESLVRILELKARNSSDHASRLEEKEADMKDEYTKLHSRYTELLKTHMDYMERTKVMLGNDRLENNISLKSKHTLPFGPLRSGMPDSVSESIDEGRPLPPNSLDYPSLSSFTSIEPASATSKLHSLKSEMQTNSEQIASRVHPSSSPKKSDSETTSPEEEHKTSSVFKEKRSTNTLYQEVSFEDAVTDPEADENSESLAVADSILAGMGKEVEQLIHENNELLATKNALNIVKDDLIAKVDELTSEIEINKDEIGSLLSQREKLKRRVTDLEEELKKTKEELEALKAAKSDDEEDVPMAQRKRFTRVEMARVLMERNQFKERLMELEEAMKWADMMRASKNDVVEPKKTRGSIWKLFSSLFSSTDRPDRAIQYNAPSEQVSPALDIAKRKRNQNLDFMDSEITSERMQQQRAKQRREHYKQVKAHVKKEDGRMQAYGWSLPSPPSGSPSEEDKGVIPSPLSVPAPVYCRPLIEKDPGLKIWCAAGIDLSGGKMPDGGSIVGASVFYSSPAPVANPANLSDVEKLNQQLKDQEALRREQEELEQQLSSLVWICTSTHSSSSVTVVDANNPGDVLDSFPVCSSHLLTIASIPGAKPTDFPVDEEFLNLGVENASQPSSQGGSSSQDIVENRMGTIKFISCATGASVSLLQPPSPAAGSSTENSAPAATSEESSQDRWKERTSQWVVLKDPPEIVKDGVNTLANHNPLAISQMKKMSTILPTMWLGAQNGRLYIHSSVAQWFRCIDSVQLQDAILNIVHIKGRIFTSQANGTVAIFHRSSDGQWDLVNYHLLDLGQPHHSIRCMAVVHNKVWCGYRNRIHVIDARTLSVEAKFEAHPRRDSQVRLLAWTGDGVWVSIRLDSTLRLYHAHTRQHLQDVDIEPYVTKMLGTGKLGFSFVRITALLISSFRLWIGTGNGVIISVPLSDKESLSAAQKKSLGIDKNLPLEGEGHDPKIQVYTDSQDVVTPASYIPYLSMSQAQLSFHGHRDAVKFFIAVPGRNTLRSSRQSSEDVRSSAESTKYMLVMSGGEGYIDFRLGDGDDEEEIDKKPPIHGLSKGDSSHLIAWQVGIGGQPTH